MKIYTQTGDRGRTSLFSGERMFKDHVRIRAYGEVDELNAVIGALTASLPTGVDQVADELEQIQSSLFHLGAWLATTPESEARQHLRPITEKNSRDLETRIDAMTATLPELRSFILPGGHPSAAWTHIARAVCRRTERTVIELARQESAPESREDSLPPVLVFLNRLSDYFFVLARFINRQAHEEDVIWQG